ncbi:MAG: hypothetical protein M1830_008718 [Pleopsidium flavum]|nr:MAG: hypothetical protein M1830_008718 [Pleopsidium flavum]
MSDTENSSAGVPLLQELPSSRSPSPTRSNKRKRDAASELAVDKTIKRKKKRKTRAIEDDDLDVQLGLNNAIGRMDGQLLADYVAQRTKRFGGDLSLVELEDRHIPEKAFIDTSSWAKPRKLSSLAEFLEHYSTISGQAKNLSSSSKLKGAPHTIVVTGAGLRAADLTRALRTFQTKDATVAKLFAKHIKLKDALQFVKSTRIGIAVGTPTRLTDLLDNGALSLEKLERIVVDGSHIDQKKRGILDMKETQIPLMQFLNRKGLKDRYGITLHGVNLLFY